MPIETSPDGARRSTRRQLLIAVLAIVTLVITAYSNSLDASWHFDDEQNIVNNRRLHLTELTLENIRQTFFASVNGRGDPYRPVACFAFALNYYFGKDHVFGYHLVNLAVHTVTAVFLFLFLCRVLRLPTLAETSGRRALLIAVLATLFWALNPVQTQAVTYIVQRMASLAGMFTIMALYFYLRARTARRTRDAAAFFFGCALCGILGVGSKENAAMLPFSLLLFDLLLLQGVSKERLKAAGLILPLLVLVPLGAAVLLKGASFLQSGTILGAYQGRGFTLVQRLLTEPRIVLFYISLLLAPLPGRLSITHTVELSSSLLDPPSTVVSIIAILAMIAAAAAAAKKRPLFSFAVLFFFINHLIESTLIPLELIYEHRNYIPSMFFFAPVVAAAAALQDRAQKRWLPPLICAAGAAVLFGFAFGTYTRNVAWKTEESLWLDAVGKHPHSARAYHNLGRAYAEKGYVRRALYAYQMALENPEPTHGRRHHVTHYNLAALYQSIGDAASAEAQMRRSLELEPDNPEAHTNLAVLIAGKGRFAEAAAHLQTAVDLDPLLQQARTNLGYMLIKLDRLDNAVAVLKGAIEMDPSDAKALYNLGIAYAVGDEREKAADCFEALLFQNPRAVLPRLFLAQVRLEMGRKSAARQTLELLADLLSPEELSESIDALRYSGPLETVPNEPLLRPFLRPLIEGK